MWLYRQEDWSLDIQVFNFIVQLVGDKNNSSCAADFLQILDSGDDSEFSRLLCILSKTHHVTYATTTKVSLFPSFTVHIALRMAKMPCINDQLITRQPLTSRLTPPPRLRISSDTDSCQRSTGFAVDSRRRFAAM